MEFTARQMTTADSHAITTDWGIILDNEHIMFTGTYQECEDWLDRHDAVQSQDSKRIRKTSPGHGERRWFSRIVSRVARLVSHCKLRQLFNGDAGHCTATEAVGVTLMLAMLYTSFAVFSWTFAGYRMSLFCDPMRRACSASDPATRSYEACHGASQEIVGESVGIVQ